MEERLQVETRFAPSRAIRSSEVHHEPSVDRGEEIRYADLRTGHFVPASDCMAVQVRLRSLYPLEVFVQNRRNPKYFHAPYQRGDLKDRRQLR